MHDMHCHLAFMTNAEEVAAEAEAAGTLLFTNSVTPDEWRESRGRFAPYSNVIVGFGLHPWWVGNTLQVSTLVDSLNEHNPVFIGEVGLDLGRRHESTRDLQLQAFDAIANWAGEQGGRVLSLHSVHATADVFDTLERSGALESCTCLFHWFTGPSDLLKRAVLAGCYFSIGPRMLATGKGREYVKAIPVSQMLLETDAPPSQGTHYSYVELRAELEKAATGIAAIRGEEALATIDETARKLLMR